LKQKANIRSIILDNLW